MTEANWYTDPQDPSRVRYWDGEKWTSHTSAAPSAPTSAFDAAARGVQWNTDVASDDIVITVDANHDAWWRVAGSGAATTARSVVGGLIAAVVVGAVWFGVNRFIADAGYRISGFLVSTLPAMLLSAVIGFFASDRRERPGWAASMFATLLASLSLSIATNGALDGYFSEPGGVFVSCMVGATYAGAIAYAGRARAVSRWLDFLNVLACLFVSLTVCSVVFSTEANPIGAFRAEATEECVLLEEWTESLGGDSLTEQQRTWSAFYAYVQTEVSDPRAQEIAALIAVQAISHSANPDDAATEQKLDELVGRYADRRC